MLDTSVVFNVHSERCRISKKKCLVKGELSELLQWQEMVVVFYLFTFNFSLG